MNTPGPWKKHEGYGINACVYGGGKLVADCSPLDPEGRPEPITPEAEANARLVAAAPEMGSALQALLSAIASTPGAKHVKELMEAVSDAGMALKKAGLL